MTTLMGASLALVLLCFGAGCLVAGYLLGHLANRVPFPDAHPRGAPAPVPRHTPRPHPPSR